jgi:hypothetical protein
VVPLSAWGKPYAVPNRISRYELGQRDRLIANPDGSVDLHLQADPPGKEREANWLPAPRGKFNLVMRLYAPRTTPPSILEGPWTPPPVPRTQITARPPPAGAPGPGWLPMAAAILGQVFV